MRSKKISIFVCLMICAATFVMASGTASAASPSYDDWEISGDLAGWRQNTAWTHVEVADTGGNPGGYLHTRSDGGQSPTAFWAGACSEKAELSGDFGIAPTIRISFDLYVSSSSLDINFVALRFRYHDATYNGWLLILTTNPTRDAWVTHTVDLNPTWTDTEAAAAGWANEDPIRVPSFSTTMADVYYTEVRMFGNSAIDAGIDNFQLEGGCIVEDLKNYIWDLPEDAWWKNPDQRANAMANKLDAVADLINAEDYEGAIYKLVNDIRTKMDGDPTAPDWVIDPVAQADLCAMIDALIACLQMMS